VSLVDTAIAERAPTLPSPASGGGYFDLPSPACGEGREGAPRDDSAAVTVVTKTPFVGL